MVRNLEVGALEAGEHARIWDGRDESGGHVASGVYFARLEAGVLVISKPLVLLK
ncbi:MAG: FlgD immunoglobulin-like domain containing protein [Candidatus Krumholzibacteriia bacterium]